MKFRAPLLLILSTLLAPPVLADNARLSSDLKIWKVIQQDKGGETLQPADTVKPGDLLQYTAVYQNAGRQPVGKLVASLPIPQGTEFVGASAMPPEVQASVDGVAYAPVPLMRKLRRADGQVVDVPVPLAEYRALRWPEQQLAAGASLTTSARVRVVALGNGTAGAAKPATVAPAAR